MNPFSRQRPATFAGFFYVLIGGACFWAYQYAIALHRLTDSSKEMANKFSVLARDQYVGFLVLQNLQMLIAYAILGLAAAALLQPIVNFWTSRSRFRGRCSIMLRSLLLTALLHGFFVMRLVDTRPYFLNEAEFGHWYFKIIDSIPDQARPVTLLVLFTIVPCLVLLYALIWHIRRFGKIRWSLTAVAAAISLVFIGYKFIRIPAAKSATVNRPMNVIVIGSDSLRADRLGCAGYIPQRSDGAAKAGVSPVIDALARRSSRFENCYTSIASTIESGVQLMSAQYPQTNGIRQMYPSRETVDALSLKIETLPAMLRARGYDTAAIGDWCAGYYEVTPLGFEDISVSSFDNFKIYMSQAVVMAHFVVPLYFDNSFGYKLFPQLGAFAQFVTPEVVTKRVEERLTSVASEQKPFFWHVFYSCNHLPYRSREPYCSMFADPSYSGPNRNGVDFDIDSFIGGTDLESKWKALPQKEVQQIRALYDGCTRQFDDCVGKILESLKKNGLAENTIVIVTADHGDDHYEPGVTLGHGLTFNGGLQANHVPMIVHVPGTKPQIFPQTVRLIDVMPTLADLIGEKKSPTWEGKSFASWIHEKETPEYRPFYGETGFPFIQFSVKGVERPKLPSMDELTTIDVDYNYQFVLKPEYLAPLLNAKQRCLKSRYWKIVCTPTAQSGRHFALFQMDKDPHAEMDLGSARPEVLEPMKRALERWMDQQIETSLSEIFPQGEPQ